MRRPISDIHIFILFLIFDFMNQYNEEEKDWKMKKLTL